MTVRDLIERLGMVPAKTEIFAHAAHRLYKVARARTLQQNLTLLSDREKDLDEFTTKFAGRVSRWRVGDMGTKEKLLFS